MSLEYKIYVGTVLKMKRGFMKGSFRLMYCGMIDQDVFVLSPLAAQGYQGFSPNIYYNSKAAVIQVLDKDFDVIEVTPEYIILGD